MKRFVIAPMLILALASMSFSPISAHTTSGSDCGDLLGKIGSARLGLGTEGCDICQSMVEKANG